jgi:hypothetical protein
VIPEFTDSELHYIRDLLTERYHKEVEIQLANCDLVLEPGTGETVPCPTVLWHEENTNFVVFKIGMFCFRTQFFYTPHEQYSTDIEKYSELGECVTAILDARSNHERENHHNNSDESGDSKQTK